MGTKKTFAEIVEAIKFKLRDIENEAEIDDDYEESEYGSIQRFDNLYNEEEYDKLGLGKIVEMEDGSKGGSDRGSDYRRVFHFVDHNVYLEISGFYSSYDGVDFSGDWEDCSKEVRPYQEMITVYK